MPNGIRGFFKIKSITKASMIDLHCQNECKIYESNV